MSAFDLGFGRFAGFLDINQMSDQEKLPERIAIATISARLNRALSDRSTSCAKLNELARELEALPWPRRAVVEVGKRRLNLLSVLLRHAATDLSLLRGLIDAVLAPLSSLKSMAPNRMEQWGSSNTHFSLHDQDVPAGWPVIFTALHRAGYISPADIATRSRDGVPDLGPPPRSTQFVYCGRRRGPPPWRAIILAPLRYN